jgi:hypothetical protein
LHIILANLFVLRIFRVKQAAVLVVAALTQVKIDAGLRVPEITLSVATPAAFILLAYVCGRKSWLKITPGRTLLLSSLRNVTGF